MSTVSSPPVAATLAPPRVRARRSHALYLGASTVFAAIAFVGFVATYWTPIAAGTIHLHPSIHVHAWLYFLWPVFYVAQTALVARGRTAWHRELGLFGIALASAMVFAGVLAAIVGLQSTLPVRPEFARTSLTLSLSSVVLFTTFVTLSIASIRRPERHKRLMVLAGLAVLQAPLARLIRLATAFPLSQRVLTGTVLIDVLFLAIVLFDRRETGRIHPVWIFGGLFLIVIRYGRLIVMRTQPWEAFIQGLARLGT